MNAYLLEQLRKAEKTWHEMRLDDSDESDEISSEEMRQAGT